MKIRSTRRKQVKLGEKVEKKIRNEGGRESREGDQK